MAIYPLHNTDRREDFRQNVLVVIIWIHFQNDPACRKKGKAPGLYDLVEQNFVTYIVDIQDNDSKRRTPHGMKKPFGCMRVVKNKDLFAKTCFELGTHHSFKVSVHPLISSFHNCTYISVSPNTRPPFLYVICRLEGVGNQMTPFPSRTDKLFVVIHKTAEGLLSFPFA